MKVLVSSASRHGSTTEVAAAITAVLRARGIEAVSLVPDQVTTLEGFDAAVIGSAIYVGRWLEPARELVDRHRDALRRMPVWLFSSGPVGDPPKPAVDPMDASPLLALAGAREHRVFAGLVDKRRLGFAERAIMAAVRAPEGDFRAWPDIEAWAAGIADALAVTAPA